MQINGARAIPRKRCVQTPGPHRALLVLLTSLVVLMLTVLGVPAAIAHTQLTGTDPADGQVLPEAPATLTLSFNEPIGVSADSTQLLTPSGESVPLEVQAVDTTVTLTPQTPVGPGTHTVVWQVTSADGHPVTGSFTFAVGSPSATTIADSQVSPLPPAMIAGQSVTYLGVFAAAGLVVFELIFLTAAPGTVPGTRRRLHRLACLAAATAAAGALFSALAGPAGKTTAASAPLTDPLVVSVLTVAGVLVAVYAAPRATGGRSAAAFRAAALAGAAVAGVSLVLTGHTRTAQPGWLVVTADAVHIAAGITWVGGILGLITVLVRASDTPARDAATTLTRFSTAAAWVVTALAATGLVLGWRILGSTGALVTTGYGQMLLIKLTLVLLVVLVAAWNRYVLLPRVLTGHDAAALPTLRSAIQGEATVLALILLITGILTHLSP